MEKNKGGRPPKYPYDMLLEELRKFVRENPLKIMINANLGKLTSVPSYAWRDNSKIQEDIKRLSMPVVIGEATDELTELVNIIELVENNYSNKKRLIEKLRDYMDFLNKLYKKALENQKLHKQLNEANNTISKLTKDNKQLKEANNSYKTILKRYAIKSRSLKARKDFGISNNLLVISGNEDYAGATSRELAKKLERVKTDKGIENTNVNIDSPEFKDLWS